MMIIKQYYPKDNSHAPDSLCSKLSSDSLFTYSRAAENRWESVVSVVDKSSVSIVGKDTELRKTFVREVVQVSMGGKKKNGAREKTTVLILTSNAAPGRVTC